MLITFAGIVRRSGISGAKTNCSVPESAEPPFISIFFCPRSRPQGPPDDKSAELRKL